MRTIGVRLPANGSQFQGGDVAGGGVHLQVFIDDPSESATGPVGDVVGRSHHDSPL
jgi:hypothetical protein